MRGKQEKRDGSGNGALSGYALYGGVRTMYMRIESFAARGIIHINLHQMHWTAQNHLLLLLPKL